MAVRKIWIATEIRETMSIFFLFFIWCLPLMIYLIIYLQKHPVLARNIDSRLELFGEEVRKENEKMSKQNHKNGDHGDQKLEEQGLIDDADKKIGERF